MPSRIVTRIFRGLRTTSCASIVCPVVLLPSRIAGSYSYNQATGRLWSKPVESWRSFQSETAPVEEEPLDFYDFKKLKNLLENLPDDHVIVDAREPGELIQTGTIPNAINIPISSSPDAFHIHPEDFEDKFGFDRPGTDKKLVFFCKAGVRSHAAAKLAREAGWRTAEYPGSWVDWVANGGDIVHSYN